ncbi:diaminopropionate ammonia-lyase [Leptothoe sp. PORK10 BA2]|uniref:diaminopropionate ammonia-lyase n=1 Tax=Leptothoe sp. PORK10 BA2 TaxID=3110254 RepID=UPI002B211A75|nr:diaminopropionate ammonia-lyase [Leptothoe sp. PORK10 BA2]MEA5465981.1 diaminopropionate ammonia-lyase [Leptothoe sp. PORK10 BA2]
MDNAAISYQVQNVAEKLESALFAFANDDNTHHVSKFHRSLPNYSPTPLVKLSQLANHLGIGEILVKDESYRLGLNSFKGLGASYAIAKHLGKLLKLNKDELTFSHIVSEKSKYKHSTFVTATDGNHGRAVAWAANLLGCKSVVYLPKGSSPARLNAIRNYGANASITTLNYDDTVLYAAQKAQAEGWILLQDTSWDGYEEVPTHIMQGYSTLITEYLHQEPDIWPTHVFVQAGVGSLAAGILARLCHISDRPMPRFVVVEPQGAPCLFESKTHNRLVRVQGDLPTIMAGLACGEPSHLGWALLKSAASAFLICSDDVARRGMKVLGNPLTGDQRIISGESGAVTLGTLFEILSNADFFDVKQALNLTFESKVLLFSTEGDTDPQMYRDIVWR